MADLAITTKLAKQSLYEMGYEYLRDNFHKLKQDNKIKVAISVIQIFNKDGSKSLLPQQNLTLVFNGNEKEMTEVKERLSILTGNNPQIEIQSKAPTD